MAIPPPPPGFTLDTPGGIGRPVIRKGADPSKPEFIPGSPGQVFDPATGGAKDIPGFKPKPPADKTTFRTLTAKEAAGQGLPPGVYQQGSDGKVDKVGDLPKIEADLGQAIKGLGIDELLTNIGRARKQIKTGFATGVLGALAGHFPGTPRKDFLGSLEGIKGASILEKLQALRDQSKNGSSGMGSLTEQEGERLANSIASLSPDMSADELNQSLDIMERHARSLQAVGAGKDPSDAAVQKEFGILPLPGTAPPNAPPQNPLAGGYGGDAGPTLTPSGGQTRSVIDPTQRALGAKIVGLMSKGADRNTIMGFAVRASPKLRDDPEFKGWVDKALIYRKAHPGAHFPIDPSFYTSEVPLSIDEKNRNQGAQSALGAATMNAGNAATAGLAAKTMGDDAQRALAVSAQQHPTASMLGALSGGTLAAMGGEGALGGLGMGPGLLRGALADSAYGAASGAGSNEDTNVLGRVANGALYGLGGSVAGQGLLRVPGAMMRGASAPAAQYVAREVPGAMTIGQAAGGKLKGFEDSLSGIRVVGDTINARRLEGLQKMNSKAFDRALEPIKGNVGGQFGEEAVAAAQDKVSGAFTKALAGKMAHVDTPFMAETTKALQRIRDIPRVGQEVAHQIEEMGVGNPDNLAITGENMQAMLRTLQQIKGSYRGDPLGHQVGQAVGQIEQAVEGLFERKAPEVMPDYRNAKLSFKRLSTLESAVLSAKNESDGKNAIFTSGQLGLADRANTVKFGGKHAAAAGKGEFHEFQRNMQSVLPNKVPDSGTAGRLLLPLALVGAGGGAGELTGETKAGLTLGGLLALAYTKGGQRALMASFSPTRGNAARTAGRALAKSAPAAGHAAAAGIVQGPPGE